MWAIWSSPPPSPSCSLPPPPTLLPLHSPPTISWETFLRSPLPFLCSAFQRPSLSSLWPRVVFFSSGMLEIFWFYVHIIHLVNVMLKKIRIIHHLMLEKTRLQGSHYLMFGFYKYDAKEENWKIVEGTNWKIVWKLMLWRWCQKRKGSPCSPPRLPMSSCPPAPKISLLHFNSTLCLSPFCYLKTNMIFSPFVPDRPSFSNHLLEPQAPTAREGHTV